MSQIYFEILFVLLLIVCNGIFAMSEIAVVSVRKARLQQLVNQGDKQAQAALELAQSPNRFLSTVQIGITLIGIFAGAFGGATLSEKIAAALADVPALAPYSTSIGLAVVVLGTTYLSLVIGELAPKRLGLQHADQIARLVARPMQALSRLASPVVSLLGISTEAVLRLIGVEAAPESPVTEEEIKVLVEQGAQAGLIEEAERDMVESVFRLGDRRVEALMTPRTEIAWIDIDDPPEIIQQTIMGNDHSRFPVCEGTLDKVLGVVLVKDLLALCLSDQPLDLRVIMQRPLFVPESMNALKILELFKQTGMQMALLIDEYGGIEGLVTLNDILEAIVGDIPTIEELQEPPVVQREDGTWLIDGMLSVDEFKEIFGLRQLPEEETYQTVGGFVVMKIGRLPTVADHFVWANLRFEVMDMDGNRVDKVLISPIAGNSAPADDSA